MPQFDYDPLQNFLYALKAPDSKRQYPRRLEYFFDYLGLTGTLKEKCIIFYNQAKNDIRWTQHQLMLYIEFQKERVEKGEGDLDMEATSYDDIFDGYRLSLRYYLIKSRK